MLDDVADKQDADTLEVKDQPKSSARVLSAIEKAERSMHGYQSLCDHIDEVYSECGDKIESDWVDSDYDLFWASMEIMKPAIYARPPKPVVSPQFKDRRKLQNLTADLLERSVTSGFGRTDLDEAMTCTRDDLIFYNRGQLWVTYETDEGQKVCVDHVDRKDFLHPPARKWKEVPWVAQRAWMTKEEMKERFEASSKDAYLNANEAPAREDNSVSGEADHSRKCGVWEVWHKADNRVYWVAKGVNVMLDEGEPHLKLSRFFPCPKPAYGTRRARTLVPIPDYVRYRGHFKKINSLTRRIYDLLDMIRMKGLIPAGGDIGDAVEQAIRDDSNTALLIPVPSAALIAGSAGGFVQWMPLADIATAIQGLIEARKELFSDFDRLSGISDIMRGESESDETLGAQQLKSQYGSVRVRCKIDELQRIARDVTQIAAEIMADNFSKETLLEMSQMEVKTKAEIKKNVDEIQKEAKDELLQLGEKAKEMAQQAAQQAQQPAQGGQPQQPGQTQQGQPDPQQQFQQAQQQIIAKYAPQLKEASEEVPIEDVMKLLRDDKARGFAFEIETDSTVLQDEMAEKASRNEFLQEFTQATQATMTLAAAGPAGAKLAGEMLKFALQPYRVGRSLNSVIDEFIDAAPQMAAQMAGQGSGDAEAQKAVADANQKLAQAELIKAQAKVAETQAKAEQGQADSQRKMLEMQVTAQESEKKFQTELSKLQAQVVETQAKIRNLDANTALTLSKIGSDNRTQDREDIKTVADIHGQHQDRTMAAQDQQRQAVESDHDMQMGERQQGMAEQQGERQEGRADRQQDFSERSTDRQMTLAERQAAQEPA